MTRTAIALTMFALLLLPAGSPAVPGSDVSVRWTDGRLSVDARDVPLRVLLGEIARVSGTKVTVDAGAGDGLTSVSFKSLAIDEALRRILRAHAFGLLYSADDVVEVRVYRDPAPAAPVSAVAAVPSSDPQLSEPLERLQREALGDPDAAVRSAAVDKLSESVNNDFVVKTAVAVLERDREPAVLLSALDLLTGRLSVPLEPVIRHAGGWSAEIRIQALELLSRHRERDPRVESMLHAAATSDPDEAVRATAQTLLGREAP